MDRLFKTFLLWLLTLALPVQGMAATVKICGPAHQHRVAEHRIVLSAHHHDAMLHGGHATDDASHGSGKHMDSPCCLATVMLPSFVGWSPVIQRIAFALAPPVSRFSGYISEGLKRPPRASLV